MSEETHIEELIERTLLTVVDSADAPAVRAHLATCAACADRVMEVNRALVVIPRDVSVLTPGSTVRSTLLATAERDPRRERHSAAWTTPAMGAAAVAVVAMAVATALLVWSLSLSGRLDARDAELVATRAAAGSFAESAEMLHMESDFGGNTVNAAIAVPPSGSEITVVVTGLPPLDDGSGYRLWLFADGQAETSVPLDVDEKGRVVATLAVDLSQFDEMELDAQSVNATAPGGDLVLGGSLR